MSRRDVKNILLENRYFIKLRYSALFLKLWSFLRPSWKKELLHQRVYYHQFFTQLKPGKHIAFDIGANEGFITQLFLQFGVFVVAAEPDKRNVAILSRRFKARKRFQLFPGAIGENNEKHPFFL